MCPIPINSIITDPLAGCLPIMQEPGAGTNMLRGLLLRLRLYYSEATCQKISDQVIEESKKMVVNTWEYVINETLHELRRPTKEFSEAYEVVILNSWAKELLKSHPEDHVLDFLSFVKANRKARKR